MKRISTFLLLLGFAASAGHAQLGAAYDGGRTRLSLGGGYGSFNDQDYFVLGAGAGYYLFEGFEAGVDGEAWLGSRPHIYTLSPEATYILPLETGWKPYIGGFYKRTFYDSELDSINSAGGRAGATTAFGEHTSVNAGLVYEKLFHCDTHVYSSCTLVYPELGFSFSY